MVHDHGFVCFRAMKQIKRHSDRQGRDKQIQVLYQKINNETLIKTNKIKNKNRNRYINKNEKKRKIFTIVLIIKPLSVRANYASVPSIPHSGNDIVVGKGVTFGRLCPTVHAITSGMLRGYESLKRTISLALKISVI